MTKFNKKYSVILSRKFIDIKCSLKTYLILKPSFKKSENSRLKIIFIFDLQIALKLANIWVLIALLLELEFMVNTCNYF